MSHEVQTMQNIPKYKFISKLSYCSNQNICSYFINENVIGEYCSLWSGVICSRVLQS